MQKIYYSDVDKTLMDDTKDYSKAIEEMIEIVDANGDLFVPCSGRPTNSLLRSFENFKVPYVIGFNGAQILDIKGNVIVDNGLTLDEVSKITNALKSLNLDYLLYDDAVKTNNIENKYALKEAELTGLDIKELKEDFPSAKVLGLSNPEFTDENIVKLKALLPEFEISKSLPSFIEIVAPNISKGNSILTLNKKLNLTEEVTTCFGDSDNDLSMFEIDINRVAVGNANNNVKDKADLIIGNCEDYGVMEYIKGIYKGE